MFSNYSSLFRSGLLTETTSPSHAPHAPWSSEFLGPRRGSLPMSVETMSLFSDFNNAQRASSSSSPDPADTLYFTFKKKRTGAEQHLSFLSLDLAESQSLRSESIRKSKAAASSSRHRRNSSSVKVSFVPAFSPPPPFSPPGSPLSARSDPDPSIASLLAPIPHLPSQQPSRRSSHIIPGTAAQPTRSSTFPPPSTKRQSLLKRDLSPMRFAPPSPPPLAPLPPRPAETDVLSRSSTISSSYRRTQRVDALSRLEGKCADGAVGRILRPRLSQNFMHLSDDEDEEENWADRGMNIIREDEVESGASSPARPQVQVGHSKSKRGSRAGSSTSSSLGLSISVNGQPWLSLTPRQNAWGVLFNGDEDGDIDVEVDRIFGLDVTNTTAASSSTSTLSLLRPQQSPVSDVDSCASPKAKRSKMSFSPNTESAALPTQRQQRQQHQEMEIAQPTPKYVFPAPPPAFTRPSHSRSSSRSRYSVAAAPSSSSFSLSHQAAAAARARTRTVSDSGTSYPPSHSQSRQSRAPRLDLRLDWLHSSSLSLGTGMGAEEPSFIDLRDDCLETDSRSDEWHSLFEVSCAS